MKIPQIITRRPEITIAVSALLFSALVAYLFYQSGDSPQRLRASGDHLRRIYRALQNFQSEAYFGKPPRSLSDLVSYKSLYYLADLDSNETASNSFMRIERNYKLLIDPMVLFAPGVSDKEPGKSDPDYGFLPWYESFLPGNTVIAWDKPGTFETGGNVLYANGNVQLCNMKEDEYKLFVRSLRTKSGRDFVRQKCPEASVVGFSKEFADEDITSAAVDRTEPSMKTISSVKSENPQDESLGTP